MCTGWASEWAGGHVRAYFPRPISRTIHTHTAAAAAAAEPIVSGTRNERFRLRRWEPEHMCVQQSKMHIIIIITY